MLSRLSAAQRLNALLPSLHAPLHGEVLAMTVTPIQVQTQHQ